MLERVRELVARLLPAPTLRVRVERCSDPAAGVSYLKLVDNDGRVVDGSRGVDSLAYGFLHQGKRVRIPRALLARVAEHGGRWVADRGFAVRDEDYPDAVRALDTLPDTEVVDAPGSAPPNIDARPLLPCEVAEIDDDNSLRRTLSFSDADGVSVSVEEVGKQSSRTWIRTPNGWRKRPRGTKQELAALTSAAELPRLTGDDVPFYLAKQLKEIERSGRRVVLLPRAAAARVVDADWTPHAEVEAHGNTVTVALSVRADGKDIPWRDVTRAKGQKYLAVGRDTWIRNDTKGRERAEAAISEIPGLKEQADGRFEAPAYALPVIAETLAPLGVIELDAAAKRLLERLRDFTKIERTPVPRALRATLRPYQEKGLDWLNFLRQFGFGGVLADDMGLGKTIQSCAVMLAAADAGETEASLVVCPASVQSVWEKEIRRWCVDLEPVVLRPGDRVSYLRSPRPRTVAITSYDAVGRNPDLFQGSLWNYLILDEAHRVKNPNTTRAKACKAIPAKHKLAVTGTPIQNKLQELWAIYDSVMPGYLGEQEKFTRRFATPITRDKDEAAATRLRARIDPFKLRRLKTQVATELPPLTKQVRELELLPDQRSLYNAIRDQAGVDEVLREVRVRGGVLAGLAKLLRLRQVCAHPRLVAPSTPLRGSSAKFEALFELVEECLEEDRKVLIFTQWTEMESLILQALDDAKIRSLSLDGSVPAAARGELVERFQAPDGPPVMVISLLAGGEGLTLTRADTVIMYDRWWNPAVEEQAIARAYRIGQRNPVTAYILETRDSVEARLAKILGTKQLLADDLVRTDGFEKSITRDQLIQLLEEELRDAGASTQEAL